MSEIRGDKSYPIRQSVLHIEKYLFNRRVLSGISDVVRDKFRNSLFEFPMPSVYICHVPCTESSLQYSTAEKHFDFLL